jgi:hypothetical protein
MVKFFTTPPKPYPYILINARNPDFRFLYYAKEVIIDSGVEMFRDPNIKDYPKGWVERLVNLYYKVKLITRAVVWVTIPDCPDDYNPKSLWLNESKTNIERTLDNILYYTAKYPNVNWLIPIQGHNRKPESIIKSIMLYKEHGILDKFGYYAVANLCVEPNTDIIYKTVKIARSMLPDKKLHVFGLKLSSLKKVASLIDSFDTVAFPKYIYEWIRIRDKINDNEVIPLRVRLFDLMMKKYEDITKTNATLERYLSDK